MLNDAAKYVMSAAAAARHTAKGLTATVVYGFSKMCAVASRNSHYRSADTTAPQSELVKVVL